MYTIADLVDETGFSVWQIYRWSSRGVISRPLKRANQYDPAVWGRVTLRELRTIRDIRENNRTMADIRDILHPEDA